jgi:hypothetical protein
MACDVAGPDLGALTEWAHLARLCGQAVTDSSITAKCPARDEM